MPYLPHTYQTCPSCVAPNSSKPLLTLPPLPRTLLAFFDSLDINFDTPSNLGIIPISPDDKAFQEKRYWRLPVPAAAIFAALITRLQYDLSDCENIILANQIYSSLIINHYDAGDGAEPSGGRGRGSGSSRGGGKQLKRKDTGGESNASAQKHKKKARNVAGGDGAGDRGESSDTSGEAFRPFWVPLGVCSQYGQTDHREIASLTLGDDMPAKSIEDNSDSEAGGSISAIDPPGEDNPDKWRFGPSFSTNKIVFTARAVNLT